MADAKRTGGVGPGERGGESGTEQPRRPERVLMVIIVPNTTVLDDVATGLLDIGIAGTVLESKGLMTLMREEMPIFGGLASMLPQNTGSKMLFSVTTGELAETAFKMIEREFKQVERPIAFTVPIDRLVGLRH
jgi:hypothetical protein